MAERTGLKKVEDLQPGDESKDYRFLTARMKDGFVTCVVEFKEDGDGHQAGERARREFSPGSQIECVIRDSDLAEQEALAYEESLLSRLNSPEPRKELAKMGARRNRALPVEPTTTEHGSTEPLED